MNRGHCVTLDAMMLQAGLMVISIIDNLLNTVVQRRGLRNVGCPVPCEVKCNYYICNEVAPVCPTEYVGDISGEAASSIEISKGIGGRQASVARQAAIVIADIKKEQRGERGRTTDRVRKRGREQTGRARKSIVRPHGNRA